MPNHTDAPDDPEQRVEYLRDTVDPATATDDDIEAWCELLAERDTRSDADDALCELSHAHPDGVRRVAEALQPYVVHENKRVWENAADILTWLALDAPEALDTTIDFLVETLDATDDQRRETAWTVLVELAETKPVLVHSHVDEIVGYLDHDDDRLRREAIGLLAAISDVYPEAIAPAGDDLLALTRDESEEGSALPEPLVQLALVRPDIARPVVEHLRDMLTDEEVRLRIAAANSLATIAIAYPDERPHVVEDLRTLAEADSGDRHTDLARSAAVRSLGRVGAEHPDGVVPELDRLTATLDDEHRLVRESAVDALGHVATVRPVRVRPSLEDLIAMLEDEDESVQFSAVRTLGKLAASDAAVAPRVVETLHEWFDRAEVVNRSRDDFANTMRWSIIDAFGRIGASHPDVLEPVVDDVRASLAQDGLASNAAEALGEIGAVRPDMVGPAVADIHDLLADDHYVTRNAAAVALGKIGAADPDVASLVVDDLRSLTADDRQYGRAAAAEALGTIAAADPDVASRVTDDIRPLANDEDRDVRSAALEALGEIGVEDPETASLVFDDLRAGLDDADPEVRSSAAGALGAVGAVHREVAPLATDALRSRLERDDEYLFVRSPIAEGLQTIKASHPDVVQRSGTELRGHIDPVVDVFRE